MKYAKWFFLVLFFLCVWLITSCTVSPIHTLEPSSPSTTDGNSISNISPSPLVMYTATQLATVTPNVPTAFIPTSTRKPNSTLRPTATLTTTPLPTLPPDQAKTVIQELYDTNGGCRLPCWWGFHPGITAWNEARPSLEPIASSLQSSGKPVKSFVYYYFNTPSEAEINYSRPRSQGYLTRDGIIESIEIDVIDLYPYDDLGEFVRSYGKPDEIWITAGTNVNPTSRHYIFSLIAFYPSQGIMLYYDDPWVEKTEKLYRACPGKQGYALRMLLWNPKQEFTFSERLEKSWEFPKEMHFKPLEAATDVSISDFYSRLLDENDSTCINTPIDLWAAVH